MFQISFFKRQFLFSLKKQFLFIIAFLFLCIGLITSFTCMEYIRLHTTVVRQNMDGLIARQWLRHTAHLLDIPETITLR